MKRMLQTCYCLNSKQSILVDHIMLCNTLDKDLRKFKLNMKRMCTCNGHLIHSKRR